MSFKLRSLIPYGNFDSLVAAMVGFWLIQVCARHGGIGISPDSVVYMSTAASIHDHGAINDFTGQPMMDFPAFYPIFLTVVQFLQGHDALAFGPFLNGLLFGTLIFLSGWMMGQFSIRLFIGKVNVYKWIVLSCIVLSPCLLEVYCMIWSETLFLLLVLLFFISARRYFLHRTTKALLWMGLVAALACVTRYAGVSLVLLGGLLILCDRSLTWKKKIGHGLVFGLMAISLLVLNIYRNRLVTGTLTGYREKAIVSFGTNLHDYGSVFCDWLPFTDEEFRWAGVVGVFFILLCGVLFLYRLRVRWELFFSYENIALSFFLVYSIFILATASLSRFQQLDSRLLSPLFIPWLWGSTSWIVNQLALRPIRSDRWQAWRVFLILGSLALTISFQVGQWRVNAENWDGVKYAGIPGYTEDQWRNSETMAYIRGHHELFDAGTTTFSNAFEGIWFFTGLRTDMLPHRDLPWDVKDFLNEKQFYVVWFDDAINTDLVTIDFITQHKKLVNTLRFHDGTIYYFTTEALAANLQP